MIPDDGLVHLNAGCDAVYCEKAWNECFNTCGPIREATCVECLREASQKRGYAHLKEWIESRIKELEDDS